MPEIAAVKAPNERLAIGRYVLVAALPSADDAPAWLAKGEGAGELDVPLVLRAVPESVVADGELMRAALEDSRVAVQIEHPHLVRLVDLFEERGRWFMVSEFVSGRTLRQIMNRAGSINRVPPIWFTVHVVSIVCQALAHLHARCGEMGTHLSSVRNTITPDTLTVSFAGDPQLMAFGLARANVVPSISNTSPIGSSYAYAAPERLSDHDTAVADVARSDVYSLGVVLYEMLTARRPFAADDEEDLLREVLDTRREPPPPSMLAPWVTQPLEEVVLTAMARDPRDRFRNVRELGEAIEKYMSWAGVRPSRKHLAQQVCGEVAHADSEPPPSARSSPSDRPPEPPRASRAPATRTARVVSPFDEARPSARPTAEHVWDRITEMARRQRAAEQRQSGPPRPAPTEHGRAVRSWGRVGGEAEKEDAVPSSRPSPAVACFEMGIDLARNGEYEAALVQLEEAVRLEPNNRMYATNLRRVKKQLNVD